MYDFIYTKGFTGWKLIKEKHRGKIDCCKIGVNFHGYEMFQIAPDLKSKLQQYMLKPFVKQLTLQADLAFSYGGKITGIIRSLGVPESKIAEIPSGIQKEMISTSISKHTNSSIKFVFLGRYERRKGILELHDVLKKLVNEGLSFKFEFIGPIPEMNQIKSPNIVYHGEIRDFKEIRSILEQSDVLVCPSWSEGFPNVILEGMASGLAIIATDVGAVSAMVSAKNGWLIEPGNKEELEKIIKEAANSHDILSSKKHHSLNLLSSTFNWNNIFEKLINSIK
ncbi:MAG: glycosyltransferase family 4 protein [Bacteroidota bacterium]